MKKQVFLIVTIILSIGIIPVWFLWGASHFSERPENFFYSADIISTDNFYDEVSGTYQGEQHSVTTYSFETVDVKDRHIWILENTFDVHTPSGEPIFEVTRTYGIDRKTGEHVPGYGDKDRTGYLFAPRGLKKGESFTYWHVNYDGPALMNYQGEETVYGLNVYKYSSSYEGVDIDQTENLDHLPGVPEERGIILDPTLTLWIEPVTGRLISYTDDTIAYYYDQQTKQKIAPWNHFTNTYTESSIIDQVSLVRGFKQRLLLITWGVPLFLGGIVVFCLISLAVIHYRKQSEPLEVTSLSTSKKWFVVGIVFLLTIVLLGFVWRYINNSIQKQSRLAFENQVTMVNDAIKDRLDIYINALRGGRGLFNASESVSREEWKAYIDGLSLQKNYPGVQGMGYAVMIDPEDFTSHIDTIRAEGFPEFSVYPEGERDVYSSVDYIEPFDIRNQAAFGFDMFQEPVRRVAMEYARDMNEPSLSGKVQLVQEIDNDVQAGFLIYLPEYEKDAPLRSIEERRNALVGYIYSPFRMDNLIKGINHLDTSNINIEIFDGDQKDNISLDTRMFISHEQYGIENDQVDASFAIVHVFTIGGHSWTLRYSALPGYTSDFSRQLFTIFFFGAGSLIVIVITGIVYSLLMLQDRAVKIATRINRRLQEVKDSLEIQVADRTSELEHAKKTLEDQVKARTEEIEKQLEEVERLNTIMIGREQKMVELKQQIKKKKPKKK